jgi:putative peptide zinc metalloprotease protein
VSTTAGPGLADAPDVSVGFFPLIRRAEDGEWIVGCAPHGPFIALPDVGVETIDLLSGGATVAGAMRELYERHGELVDVASFVGGLDQIGFIATIAGRPTRRSEQRRPRGAALRWLRPEHVSWLPTRGVAGLWLAMMAAATAILIARPRTLPHVSDLVWAPSVVLVMLADVAVLSVVTFLHELSHLAVARAHGIAGRISISTRLTFLVAQTDVTGAWALPRRRRITIYLAGMATDLGLAAACILVLPSLDPAGLTATFVRSLVLTLAMSVLLEFTFFLRTDVYFLVQDLAKCRNLYGDARRLLAYWAGRCIRIASIPDPRTGLPRHEQRAVTSYAPLLAAGTLVTLGVFAAVTLPVSIRMIIMSTGHVTNGLHSRSCTEVADGVLSLGLMAGLDGTLLALSLMKIGRTARRLTANR